MMGFGGPLQPRATQRAMHATKRQPQLPLLRRPTVLIAAALIVLTVVFVYFASPLRRYGLVGGASSSSGVRKVGKRGTLEYSVYLQQAHEETSSFWHDIPLSPAQLDKSHLVPFVAEIPRTTTAKMEINKEATWNPIKQDVKDGKLRDYPMPSVVHYGAIPQTYEHPSEEDDLTGLTGDGDPIDIVDISDYAAHTGDVYEVKVLGALAMIDDDAADWKIVAIRATDPLAAELHDLADVLPVKHISLSRHAGDEQRHVKDVDAAPAHLDHRRRRVVEKIEAFRTFLANYKKKTPTAPSPVKFMYEGSFLDAATALDVIRHHHVHWCKLLDDRSSGHRVGMLSDRFRGYQFACDHARTVWKGLLEADEAVGAAAGAQHETGGSDNGVWVPVDVGTDAPAARR